MRKISVILALVLSVFMLLPLTGAIAENEITIQDIIDASQTKAVLENHKSFRVFNNPLVENYVVYDTYVDGEYIYMQTPDYDGLFSSELEFWCDVKGTPEQLYVKTINCAGTEFSMSSFAYCFVDPLSTALEKIISCETVGDTLVVTARMSSEDTARTLTGKVPLAEGDVLEVIYNLNPETLEVQTSTMAIVSVDGTTNVFFNFHAEYDVEMPEEGKALLERATSAESTCTMTVILYPNTENEETRTIKVIPGDSASFYLPDGCAIYKDAALTELLNNRVPLITEDVTFYCGEAKAE
ncbi:MAG: hypothetical protein PHI27_01455 [Eubacteriales bacterium]|nr:hypothetical protein [Eubacteriales bacterium]MDD3880902.1 hypothetical protein [Eubacteriales bacterium]MDD4511731.1 hypothetical protein [Eubacteriales bacterium]